MHEAALRYDVRCIAVNNAWGEVTWMVVFLYIDKDFKGTECLQILDHEQDGGHITESILIYIFLQELTCVLLSKRCLLHEEICN